MLERIPEAYSPDAADAADRLRLIKCDLQTVELAVVRHGWFRYSANLRNWKSVGCPPIPPPWLRH